MWSLQLLHPLLLAFALSSFVDGASVQASVAKPDTKIASAWFTGWHADEGAPLSAVPWKKYTNLGFALVGTTPSPHNLSLDDSYAKILPEFVSTAHKNGVKAGILVGGWTGSRYFSTHMGSAQNRTAFVKTITDFVTQYKLDEVTFDWEYPNRQGVGCNAISANDTANLLSFLQQLKKTVVGKKTIVSATVSIVPFNGPDGSPVTDVAPFAKVLDYIAIMNYDVWGSWSSSVGPIAPLNDSCAAPANQQGSGVSALAAWTKAGFPKDQIVLGVAAYGHAYHVDKSNAFAQGSKTKLAEYPAFNNSLRPNGDAWSDPAGLDICGNENPHGDTFTFRGLVGPFLDTNGKPKKGIQYRFDNCSQTPFVYNSTSQVYVSYDNAQAFSAKGHFIKNEGLRGFSMWEQGGDYNDILLNAIRSGAGFH